MISLKQTRKKILIKLNNITIPNNIKIIEPLGYMDLLNLAAASQFIITDSGGLQKEAMWLKKHCITIREETEWIETLDNGWNKLTGPSLKKIRDALGDLERPKKQKSFFGDGNAAKQILHHIRTKMV